MGTKNWSWGEAECRRAIRAFRKVYPDWSIVSNQPKCPTCSTPNYCKAHSYAYDKFLRSEAGVLLLALKDSKLKEAVQKEFGTDFWLNGPPFLALSPDKGF